MALNSTCLFWLWFFVAAFVSPNRSTHSRVAAEPAHISRQKCSDPSLQKDLNSFLWLVKRTPPAYLFGTIHVPYNRVWDFIPQNSKDAFHRSRYVYFELDLTDTSTINALWKCQMLPNGERLKDLIPRSIYKRLQKHLKYVKKMIPIWLKENDPDFPFSSEPYAEKLFELFTREWQQRRPIWVMLMVNSLTETDIRSRGIPVLDLYLGQEAYRNEKTIGAVEDVAEQCQPLNSLNNTQVIFALNQTLNFQEKMRYGEAQLTYTTDDMIDHYNCGDLKSVLFSTQAAQLAALNGNSSQHSEEAKKAQQIEKYFSKALIFQRNEQMAKRVMGLLKSYPERDFFFAFGAGWSVYITHNTVQQFSTVCLKVTRAGHFLGNHSVIDIMQKSGVEVEHVKPHEPIPRKVEMRNINRNCRRKSKRRSKRRRKYCIRKRRRKPKPRKPDFSRVRLVLKVTRRPTIKQSLVESDEESVEEQMQGPQVASAVRHHSLILALCLCVLVHGFRHYVI